MDGCRVTICLMLAIAFFFVCCSKNETTQPEMVTVSGRVILEGQTDHSGVKVSLYKPVELDTALVRINREYPNIGVSISQANAFDHREQSPLHSVVSLSDGAWKIEDIQPGIYNVVAEKDSFGWRYLLNRNLNDINLESLRKTLYLSGVLTEDLILDNPFVFVDNLTIPSNRSLTINNGGYLYLNKNSKIEIAGQLILNGTFSNPLRIITYAGQEWRIIEVQHNSRFVLNYGIVKNGKMGIFNKSSQFIVANSIFMKNKTALENFGIMDTLTLNYCNFLFNDIAVNNNGMVYTKIFRNIFYRNLQSILIVSSNFTEVSHNVFYADSVAAIDINPGGGIGFVTAFGHLNYNVFMNSASGVDMNSLAFFEGNFNNFKQIKTNYLVVEGNTGLLDTLNFQNNYWGLFNIFDIENRIIDAKDFQNQGVIVDVSNFLLEPVDIN